MRIWGMKRLLTLHPPDFILAHERLIVLRMSYDAGAIEAEIPLASARSFARVIPNRIKCRLSYFRSRTMCISSFIKILFEQTYTLTLLPIFALIKLV